MIHAVRRVTDKRTVRLNLTRQMAPLAEVQQQRLVRKESHRDTMT